MKSYLSIFVLLLSGFSQQLSGQKPTVKKSAPQESKYFDFQSSAELNAHLFLYNKAMLCKFKKTPNDSMAYVALKEKSKGVSSRELSVLNAVLLFYRDSLLNKDLLFDSLMRDFSDKLIRGNIAFVKWQVRTKEAVQTFEPYFRKLVWPEIEAGNKKWLAANLPQIIKLETQVIPELERIYQTKLPQGKIRVDLTDYATWSGAYSFNDRFCHVIFSTIHYSNQGDLAPEVVFHEASHFLVDKLSELITKEAKGKDVKASINLWHNMIFYTTGYVLTKELKKTNKTFVPYYEQMKFTEKFQDFKYSVEACQKFWNTYCEGQGTMQEAVIQIVNYITKK